MAFNPIQSNPIQENMFLFLFFKSFNKSESVIFFVFSFTCLLFRGGREPEYTQPGVQTRPLHQLYVLLFSPVCVYVINISALTKRHKASHIYVNQRRVFDIGASLKKKKKPLKVKPLNVTVCFFLTQFALALI